MHRVPFVFLAIFLTPVVHAQEYPIDKGSYLLGGTLSFTSQGSTISFDSFEEDADRLTEIAYAVNFGYFVVPGLALGFDSQYQRISQSGDSQTATSIGPSLAYFFGQPTSAVYPFISASAGFSTLTAEFDGDSGSINGFRFGLSGGLSYMIARNVALTGAVFYRNQSYSEEDFTQTDDALGFQGGVTAFIF